MDKSDHDNSILIGHTADIVSAYVSNNRIAQSELASLIEIVSQTLKSIPAGGPVIEEAVPLTPAVPIRKSVTADYIICLEDGKSFKSLKRHLTTHYNLTPDAYRQKWGLPADYPMVAPNYSAARSKLAKNLGLGRKVAEETESEVEIASSETVEEPKRRGRKPKAAAA